MNSQHRRSEDRNTGFPDLRLLVLLSIASGLLMGWLILSVAAWLLS